MVFFAFLAAENSLTSLLWRTLLDTSSVQVPEGVIKYVDGMQVFKFDAYLWFNFIKFLQQIAIESSFFNTPVFSTL